MVACDLIRAAAQAVMSTLLITGNAEIWQLMAFAVVMGSAAAFFTPAVDWPDAADRRLRSGCRKPTR